MMNKEHEMCVDTVNVYLDILYTFIAELCLAM